MSIIKARWYNGGLLLQPTDEDNTDQADVILMGVMNFLKLVEVDAKVETSPIAIVEADDQQPVVLIKESFPQTIP